MSTLEHPLIASLEKHEYLRTEEILPVHGNRMVVHVAGAEAMNDPHTVSGIKDVRSIEIPDQSAVYSFTFHDFVAYCVTDETFVEAKTNEASEGRRIRLYSQSHFLDYVSAATWATSDFPGELKHYQLNTLDHSIDVITATAPELAYHRRMQQL